MSRFDDYMDTSLAGMHRAFDIIAVILSSVLIAVVCFPFWCLEVACRCLRSK